MILNIIGLYLISTVLSETTENKGYVMIKEIEDVYYIGGRNILISLNKDMTKMEKLKGFPKIKHIGSDPGMPFTAKHYHKGMRVNRNYSFDLCLNWLQEHPDSEFRNNSNLDWMHWFYHTPSGDFPSMAEECNNTFIKGIISHNSSHLWVCGTFGAFPRAFLVTKGNLEFAGFVDTNVMSCARYQDESMMLHRSSLKDLYVGSGWGLYRPAATKPDVPQNNSTMLYSEWRLYREAFNLPSAFSFVLSSDVTFLKVVKETAHYLYFFGHEINNQYSLNNQDDRNAWQSFILRICKNDTGYKWIFEGFFKKPWYGPVNAQFSYPLTGLDQYTPMPHIETDYTPKWYDDTVHLPLTLFTSPFKMTMGCYLGRRPYGISDNQYWHDTNVVYLNKLADVLFEPDKPLNFTLPLNHKYFTCNRSLSQYELPLVGLFNRAGLQDSQMPPTGAVCQLLVNAQTWPGNEEAAPLQSVFDKFNSGQVDNAHQESLVDNAALNFDRFSGSFRRLLGVPTAQMWNQGVRQGDIKKSNYLQSMIKTAGRCTNKPMTKSQFLDRMNMSTTGWPNELPNKAISPARPVCQYAAADLVHFNATFILPGVEFKRFFLLKKNIINYRMQKLTYESSDDAKKRRNVSPLMLLAIISTAGDLYRVVLCDLEGWVANQAPQWPEGSVWRDWCLFRHTDQPYLYRQYAPLEKRTRGVAVQFRGSRLLSTRPLLKNHTRPKQKIRAAHLLKDVHRVGDTDQIIVLSSEKYEMHNLTVVCAAYRRCVDCASDPECAWSDLTNSCVRYDDSKSNDTQDVLDGGFLCAKLISKKPKKEIFTTNNQSLYSFNCSRSSYWNGPIRWKVNGEVVNQTTHIKIEDNLLITINQKVHNVSCEMLLYDHDKLYNGSEYEWNSKFKPHILHSWTTEKPFISSTAILTNSVGTDVDICGNVVFICLLLASFLFIAIIIIIVLVVYCCQIKNEIDGLRNAGEKPTSGDTLLKTGEKPTSGDTHLKKTPTVAFKSNAGEKPTSGDTLLKKDNSSV